VATTTNVTAPQLATLFMREVVRLHGVPEAILNTSPLEMSLLKGQKQCSFLCAKRVITSLRVSVLLLLCWLCCWLLCLDGRRP